MNSITSHCIWSCEASSICPNLPSSLKHEPTYLMKLQSKNHLLRVKLILWLTGRFVINIFQNKGRLGLLPQERLSCFSESSITACQQPPMAGNRGANPHHSTKRCPRGNTKEAACMLTSCNNHRPHYTNEDRLSIAHWIKFNLQVTHQI